MIGLLLITLISYGAVTKWVFQNKAIPKSTTARLDTSATMTLGYANTVNLLTSAVGTDSLTIYIAVDGLWNGVWDNGVVYDTLLKAGTTGKLITSKTLRFSGAETFKYETFRVRNSVTSKADSSAPLKYNQIIIGR